MPPPDLAALLKQVRHIEVRTRRLVDALAAGAYRARFRGQGMEFEEVREYSVGDDVRHIDWNVSARAGRPYVKVFREERDLALHLVVDVSGSMRFGALPGRAPRTKRLAAAEAAAVLAITALRNHDLIGLDLISDRSLQHVPVRRGRHHAMRIIREILAVDAAPRPTALASALEEVLGTLHKRTVLFLVSDFLDPDPALGPLLVRAGRRHDLIGVRISESAEATLPATGGAPLRLVDPESGEERILHAGRAARAAYAELYASQRQTIETAFRNAGGELCDLDTGSAAADVLRHFFARRRR